MVAYRPVRLTLQALTLAALAALAGCGHLSFGGSHSDRECLARAMYFESIRSSEEGMLAVGTVVMNRVESGKYPRTVCGVVGQPRQFAPGVLTREMPAGASRDRAFKVAAAVLRGKRHRGVGKAMFFHTAGRTYGYDNMHYVAVAGGNAFYERRETGRSYIPRTLIAEAGPRDSISASGWGTFDAAPETYAPQPVVVANATPPRRRRPSVEAPATAFAPEPAPVSIEQLILASNAF